MNKQGFSLLELLLVVAIIAILTSIAVPNFLEAQTRSKISRVKSDMGTVGLALEAYRVDWNRYPYVEPRGAPPQIYLAYDNAALASWWFLDVRWEDGLVEGCGEWLTTPLAYLSSIPLDVFTSTYLRDAAPGLGGWGGGIRLASALYGTRYGTGQLDLFDGGRTCRSIGYFLVSAGPDQFLNSSLPFGMSAPPDEPVVFSSIPYDPTNGAVSYGDIVFLGRGYGFAGH